MKKLIFIAICLNILMKISFGQAVPTFVEIKLDGVTVNPNSAYTIEMASLRNISVSITYDNRGTDSPSGANGLTFSVPAFTSAADKSFIQLGSSSSSDLTYGEYYGAEALGGDTYANYVMAEASTTGTWDGSDYLTSDKKTFEVLIYPKNYYTTSYFRVLFRCAIATQTNWSDVVYDPTSGIYDCLTLYAYYLDLRITTPNTPPTAPSSPLPANGAINIPVTTNSLDWANSTDANGDAIQYEVYFGTDASPDAGEYLTTVSTSNYSGLPALSYGTTYYWQIIARDSRGATTPGPVWSFTTQIAQPDIIVESIRCEPPNPQIGQEVLLYAVIRNNGPAGAEVINWTYSINGS